MAEPNGKIFDGVPGTATLEHKTLSRPRKPANTPVPSRQFVRDLPSRSMSYEFTHELSEHDQDFPRSLSATMDDEVDQATPLERFSIAKSHITDIYDKVVEGLGSTIEFLTQPRSWVESCPGGQPVIHENAMNEQRGRMEEIKSSVTAIREALGRNSMKVVFIGRTSNGKSTTINAMLHRKVLPSGKGHTTNCFCRLYGTDADKPFLTTEENLEPQDVEDVKQLANALFPEDSVASQSLVNLYWPHTWSKMLRADVVVIDSPGLNMTEDFDSWIDTHCKDADVFILVANSVSTLNLAEKNFFIEVNKKLSKPNLFILYNQWDTVADDDEDDTPPDLVKQQHVGKATEFLSKELEVMSRSDVNDRIFFVSSKEALQHRTIKGHKFREAQDERYREFERFEQNFEECISSSAIKTRFEMHAHKGIALCLEVAKLLEKIADETEEDQIQMSKHLSVQRKRLKHLRSRTSESRRQLQEKVRATADSVKSKVSGTLVKQAEDCLEKVVNDFNKESFDANDLTVYKSVLNQYVESQLTAKLSDYCSNEVTGECNTTQADMYNLVQELLPPTVIAKNLVPYHDVRADYPLECSSIADSFKEDISFRFSLGWGLIAPKLFGTQSDMISATLSLGALPIPAADKGVLSLVNSPIGALGIAAAASLLKRSWTINVVLCCTGLYACLYAYERACYSTPQMERKFKKQFIEHALKELKVISRHTGLYASQAVHREMQQQLDALFEQVTTTEKELTTDIENNQADLCALEKLSAKAQQLREDTSLHSLHFKRFLQRFIPGSCVSEDADTSGVD